MAVLQAYVFRFVLLCLVIYLVQSSKVARVVPENEEQKDVIDELAQRRDMQIEFWKHPNGIGKAIDIEIQDVDYGTFESLMRDNKIPFEILIGDVDRTIKEQQMPSARARSSSYHDSYHNLYEIHNKLQQIANSRSSMTRIINIGSSYEGRQMKAIEIKGRYRRNKPVFFWECGIHAREWISPATCMYSIDKMVSLYGRDSSVTSLLDKMDFVILPVMNVDGYAYTWKGRSNHYRMWRKNRRPSGGCTGTDLNRNWGYKWGGAGASARPCDSTYRGSRPFSEKETVNVKTYLENLGGRLKGFIDMHAYSQMWFTPWGYTSSRTPHYSEQYRVAQIASRALGRVYGTRYTYGSSAKLLYAAAGGSEDWVYQQLGVQYSFSVELRDKGRYGFLLPERYINPTGRETFEGVKALVQAMRV